MGRSITFRDVIGLLKDKASLSKAALLSKPSALSLRLAVLRVTTHSPPGPPDDHHLSALLLLGQTSRDAASPIINSLMDRLHRTSNCVVALKCLLIIHHIIRRGSFILQDQLSIFPATGGHNYLKLSAFRDRATAASWELSSWVRWYARYLETLLSTSRVLGYFISSPDSCRVIKERQELKIPSCLNFDLIKDIDSLSVLIEEICKLPDSLMPERDVLVKEITGLLLNDYLSSANEILLRLGEVNVRLGCLSFGDSLELGFALKRLQNCEEKLSVIYPAKNPSTEMMWGSIKELKDTVETLKLNKEGGRLVTWSRREKASESARFDGGVLVTSGDPVRFQSGRFEADRFSWFLATDR